MMAAVTFWESKSSVDFSLSGQCCLATSAVSRRKCRIVCKTEAGGNQRNAALTKRKTENQIKPAGTKELLGLLRRRSPDSKTVFVAGATGQIGARISQQLLRSGFTVRGGVRDLFLAQQLAEFATQYGVISREEAKKINAVEFDFTDVESVAKAIGNAGIVVVTVGPTEDGPRSKVTPGDALRVMEAANLANVGHVVVVCEGDGVSDVISRNGPLALISGLFSKLLKQPAEVTADSLLESIVETDLNFTFVKSASTENVDDFRPDGESLVLLSEGTYNRGTGKVSKAQLASVVAGIISNVSISENKVLEVATINSDTPKPIEELLSSIPADGRRTALAEARAKAEAEQREREIKEQAEAEAKRALEEARKAAELASKLEGEARKLAAEEARVAANAERAKERAKAAAASLEGFGVKVDEIVSSISLEGRKALQPQGLTSLFKRSSSEEDGSLTGESDSQEDKGKKPLNLGKLLNRDKVNNAEQENNLPRGFGKFFNRDSNSDEVNNSQGESKKPLFGKILKEEDKPVNKPVKKLSPVKRESKEKKEQKSVLGGLFKQDTFYVDD